jgi:hypothetical protein
MGAKDQSKASASLVRRWRMRLGRRLRRWGEALSANPPGPAPAAPPTATAPPPVVRPAPELNRPRPPRSPLLAPSATTRQLPGVREPLSVEQAVRGRDLTVLRREAADALAALGAAHALVASARFTQLQDVRQQVERGQATEEDLATMAADYLGWQGDQVRLFDALSMVLGMRVPPARALDLIDPSVRGAAQAHLGSLMVEYQRRLLDQQFGSETPATEENN